MRRSVTYLEWDILTDVEVRRSDDDLDPVVGTGERVARDGERGHCERAGRQQRGGAPAPRPAPGLTRTCGGQRSRVRIEIAPSQPSPPYRADASPALRMSIWTMS